MHDSSAILTLALALGAGVLAQVVARHLRLPSIVPLLATGVLLGPDGLGWIEPDALGEGLVGLVLLGVAVILFEGGLNLDLRRLRREARAIRMLVSAGALVTAVGGTLAAHYGMGWDWSRSVLFGTLVIVTGPTVVRPILRNVPLSPRLATVIEAEGVLIDPIGAIVAAVTLQLVLGAAEIELVSAGLVELGLRLAFGAVAGLLGGMLMGGLLRLPRVIPEGLENVVTLGLVLVLFVLCERQVADSGILAVTLAGVVVGTFEHRVSRELREFQDNLTLLLLALLFVLLAADVRIRDVLDLGWPSLVTVGALVFLVRPATVVISTIASGMPWREKAFLSWIAPRGIVAAGVASIFAATMESHGMSGGGPLRDLVFLTIAVTVLVQGATAPLVARALGVRAPDRQAVAILSAEELPLALGEVLRGGGMPVTFVDANPSHCRAAQEREFAVVYGNALQATVLARARLNQAQAAVGLSANDEVNVLFVQEAMEEFDVPETYVAINRVTRGFTPEWLQKQGTRVLFDRPKDVERWNVRFRHGAVRLQHHHWEGPPEREKPSEGGEGGPAQGPLRTKEPADPYVILAVQRAGTWQVMHPGLTPKDGDVAAVAIHQPEVEEAERLLTQAGWARGEPEAEPEAVETAAAASTEDPPGSGS